MLACMQHTNMTRFSIDSGKSFWLTSAVENNFCPTSDILGVCVRWGAPQVLILCNVNPGRLLVSKHSLQSCVFECSICRSEPVVRKRIERTESIKPGPVLSYVQHARGYGQKGYPCVHCSPIEPRLRSGSKSSDSKSQ